MKGSVMIDTEEVRIIEMMERIESYILGRLTQDEIDELWIQILQAPEWLGYLEIEIHLISVLKSRIDQ